MAHVGQKLRLIFGRQGQLLGFFFQRAARQFHFPVLHFNSHVLLGQKRGLFFQFAGLRFQLAVGVRELLLTALQFLRLALQFLRERLRLFKQFFSSHVGGDHVQDHADAFHELLQKRHVNFGKRLEGSEFDNGHQIAFKQNGQGDNVERSRFAQTRIDLNIVFRDIGQENGFAFQSALPNQAFAQLKSIGNVLALAVCVAGKQLQERFGSTRIVDVEHAVMRRNQRRNFRHNQARHRLQSFLALHHARETREVGFEPVLLLILSGRIFEITDHLVNLVLQFGYFALRFNGNRAC